jgi:hypothetical protein
MQSGVSADNNSGNIRVMAIAFGQERPYRIYIGFWHRLTQTISRITLAITRDNPVLHWRELKIRFQVPIHILIRLYR